MTEELAAMLNLGVPINAKTCIYIESALTWILDHTTLSFDISNANDLITLPANVKLFIIKYNELFEINSGVTSESIEGLSLSFNTSDKVVAIEQNANNLLDKWLKPSVSFVSAVNRW